MGEMHGARYWERCRASMPSPGTPLSPNPLGFSNLEAFEPHPFGFLWRLHYMCIIDCMVSHCK